MVPLSRGRAAAERVIDSHEKITLSAEDWEVFYDALINPPEPNEKLKESPRRYREASLDEPAWSSSPRLAP